MLPQIKPQERTVEGAGFGAALVNGLIWLAVAFQWVDWDAERLAAATFFANAIVQYATYLLLKRTTTSLANPKTAEGTPLEPVKPLTRGIPQGDRP